MSLLTDREIHSLMAARQFVDGMFTNCTVGDYNTDEFAPIVDRVIDVAMSEEGQSKGQSLTESLTNTAIGYIVAVVSQLLIFPLFDIHIAFHDNLLIALWFTGISIARSYLLRRYFNRGMLRGWGR